MRSAKMEILVIVDDIGEAGRIAAMLRGSRPQEFSVEHARYLADGLVLLRSRGFHCILVDLRLPGSQGLETALAVRRVAKRTPLVVLIDPGEEEMAINALQDDIQDYLVKGEITGPLLIRSVRHAVERKRIAEELRESEQRFASFMLHMPVAAWIKDLHGRYVYANAEAERIFPAPLSALQGKTDGELFPPQTARQFRENDERVLSEGGSLCTTEVLRQADGIDHLSIVSKFAVPDPDGRPAHVAGVAVDITERKKAEELLVGQKRVLEMIATNAPLEETLAALMNFMESGSPGILASILLLDEDGAHVRHGAAPSLPEAYLKAIDGAVIGPCAGSCGTAMFRREPVVVTDILHDPLWEGYRSLVVPYGLRACWSTPIFSHDGGVLGSFAMYYREARGPAAGEQQLVDIATHIASIAIEHDRAGLAVRQARYAAEEASRSKSQFLANMSHELRTPMAGVLGMLEIALDGPLEAAQREFVQTAHNSAASLVRILNDILEMTRIESGMLTVEEKPFSLRECVSGVADIFTAEARRKGVDLVLSVADGVPDMVTGDQVRLRQVLSHLVGNAFKFTEQGRVGLEVGTAGTGSSGKREVAFTVTDTGIGIPEEKRPLLFRPFSQVDESHTRRYGGAGLGLMISKEIVERMGGTLTFESPESGGSRFTVTVPFKEAASVPHTGER